MRILYFIFAIIATLGFATSERYFQQKLRLSMNKTKFKFVIWTSVASIMVLIGHSGKAVAQVDLNNLHNYANQDVPAYITKDHTPLDNPITDEGATLGRVLFYDKKLSTNNNISCSSCHQQEFAFSDRDQFSTGVNGDTLRHSMRLINGRFSEEVKFFWDERAASLEAQASMPIKDHGEMGYSGENGAPDFQDLINKLSATPYYPGLFVVVFGDSAITEERMQLAIAQFVRSIQSFDSKYDAGLAQVENLTDDFPNFTADENEGKSLFTEDFEYVIEEVTIEQMSGDLVTTAAHRTSGGLNCATCHRPPEFDVDPASLNNGFDRPLNGNSLQERDFSVTRSPTLRDLIHSGGAPDELNSPLFHAGTSNNLGQGIKANYNFKEIHPDNANLDPRLAPEGFPQFLDITNQERNKLVAFLSTLTGTDVYTNEKWSDPFEENGDLDLVYRIGDFNRDGVVNVDDIDAYLGNIGLTAADSGFDARLDLNGDGTIDLEDQDFHVRNLVETSNGGIGTFPGDANLDGVVDVLGDAVTLIGNLGNAATSWSQGDFNADGTVNVLGDGGILVNNLGNSNAGSSTAASSSGAP